MAKLTVFNLVTIDGYFAGVNGDISWHRVDQEFQQFAETNSNSGSILLFGRVTYEIMANYWPTSEAIKGDPIIASGMNKSEKIVFSRTMKQAAWSNTRVVNYDLLGEVQRLKKHSLNDLTILGSGSLVAQLSEARLIDEYQMLVNPVVLGQGKTMFEGVQSKLNLKLSKAHQFKNGSMLLYYHRSE